MGSVIWTALIFTLAFLAAQQAHYAHLRGQRDHQDAYAVTQALEAKLAVLEELKKQVDTLVLKSGFGR